MSEEQNEPNEQAEIPSQPLLADQKEPKQVGLAEKLLQPMEGQSSSADPWEQETWQDLIPDKFKKDGEVDLKNLAKSYLNAEKRIGTGDVPPKDETGYKVELPEGITVDPEKHSSFLKGAHSKGMTNAQVNWVMEQYGGLINDAKQMMESQKIDSEAVLKTAWGDKFDTNLALAQKAFQAVADDDDKASINEISASPALIKILAKLGGSLKEDKGLPADVGGLQPEDLSALMNHPGYFDSKHPEHERLKAQVTRHFQATAAKR